jgi:hypothetical protein
MKYIQKKTFGSRVRRLAVVGSVAVSMIFIGGVTATTASAGTNGQTIDFNTALSGAGRCYGSAGSLSSPLGRLLGVWVSGTNQNNKFVGWSGSSANGTSLAIPGWWKGKVNIDYTVGFSHPGRPTTVSVLHVTPWIPAAAASGYESVPNTVFVNCLGSAVMIHRHVSWTQNDYSCAKGPLLALPRDWSGDFWGWDFDNSAYLRDTGNYNGMIQNQVPTWLLLVQNLNSHCRF